MQCRVELERLDGTVAWESHVLRGGPLVRLRAELIGVAMAQWWLLRHWSLTRMCVTC